MPPFLTGIGLKLIAGCIALAILAAAVLYVRHVIAENATLQSQLDEALAANQRNLKAFDAYKAHQDAVLRALADQHAADQLRLGRAAKLKQEIAHAKPADDGPVAAVLARTLDELRSPGGVQSGAPANAGPN